MDDCRPPNDWPDKGQVEMYSYCTRYREGLEPVLHNITCTLDPGERVRLFGLNIIKIMITQLTTHSAMRYDRIAWQLHWDFVFFVDF